MIQVLLHPRVADCQNRRAVLMLRLISSHPPVSGPASFPHGCNPNDPTLAF